MATALTIAQKIALFQVLEVPYATSFYTVDGMGTLSKQTTTSGTADQAQTVIATFLDTLSSTVGETELIALLNRWITIGTKTTSIDGGAIGDVSGVTQNYNNERGIIASRVKLIVPFYKWHEVLERRAGGGNISIPMMRL